MLSASDKILCSLSSALHGTPNLKESTKTTWTSWTVNPTMPQAAPSVNWNKGKPYAAPDPVPQTTLVTSSGSSRTLLQANTVPLVFTKYYTLTVQFLLSILLSMPVESQFSSKNKPEKSKPASQPCEKTAKTISFIALRPKENHLPTTLYDPKTSKPSLKSTSRKTNPAILVVL